MNNRQLLAALRASRNPSRIISADIDKEDEVQSFMLDLVDRLNSRYTMRHESHVLTLKAPLDHKRLSTTLLKLLKNHGGRRQSPSNKWDDYVAGEDNYQYWLVIPDGDSPGDVFSAVVKLYEDDREIEVHWS